MTKTEWSMEEVNTVLFDDENQQFDNKEQDVSTQQKNTPRLLKQKELSTDIDKLEPVPYYKKPIVQGAVVLAIALPIGWGLISAFSTDSITSSQIQSANPVEDRDKQLLKESLERERKKNQDLVIENGLKTQQIKVIPVKTKTAQQPISRTTVIRPQRVPTQDTISTSSVSQPVSQPKVIRPTPSTFKPDFQAINHLTPTRVKPEKTSIEKWIAAANVGSFGSTSSASSIDTDTDDSYQTTAEQSNDSTTATNSDSNAEPELEINGGIGSVPYQSIPEQSNASTNAYTNYPNSESQQQSEFNSPVPNRIIQSGDYNDPTVNYSANNPQLIVGTKASGKLETGVAWSGDLNNATRSLLIKLSEPLLASDNTEVIPKGASLVARVDSANDSGLLEMSVVSVLVNKNSRTIEKPLPEAAIRTKAIQILGKGGNYLQAKETRRNNVHNNIGMMVLSGAARVAGLSNQSDYQSVYNNGDFAATTISRDPNYLAGFGQGAADEFLRQQRQRTQQIQQSIESQPNVFVLERGTTVQVYVNQTTAFE